MHVLNSRAALLMVLSTVACLIAMCKLASRASQSLAALAAIGDPIVIEVANTTTVKNLERAFISFIPQKTQAYNRL
jgi:hypothetical protein